MNILQELQNIGYDLSSFIKEEQKQNDSQQNLLQANASKDVPLFPGSWQPGPGATIDPSKSQVSITAGQGDGSAVDSGLKSDVSDSSTLSGKIENFSDLPKDFDMNRIMITINGVDYSEASTPALTIDKTNGTFSLTLTKDQLDGKPITSVGLKLYRAWHSTTETTAIFGDLKLTESGGSTPSKPDYTDATAALLKNQEIKALLDAAKNKLQPFEDSFKKAHDQFLIDQAAYKAAAPGSQAQTDAWNAEQKDIQTENAADQQFTPILGKLQDDLLAALKNPTADIKAIMSQYHITDATALFGYLFNGAMTSGAIPPYINVDPSDPKPTPGKKDFKDAAAKIEAEKAYQKLFDHLSDIVEKPASDFQEAELQWKKDHDIITGATPATDAEKEAAWKDEQVQIQKEQTAIAAIYGDKGSLSQIEQLLSSQLSKDFDDPNSDIQSIMSQYGLGKADIDALSKVMIDDQIIPVTTPYAPSKLDPEPTPTPVGPDAPSTKNLLNPPIANLSGSSTIPTIPGHWYLVAGNISGKVKTNSEGDKVAPGGISTQFGPNDPWPQGTNEIDSAGTHARYYWVQATGSSMTVKLTGDKDSKFSNIGVYDLGNPATIGLDGSTISGQAAAMAWVKANNNAIGLTKNDLDVGEYPQVKGNVNGNLFDGNASIQKGIPQGPLNNAGHPYWYFDAHYNSATNPPKIIPGPDGKNVVSLPGEYQNKGSSDWLPSNADTNGPVAIPAADYNYSCDITVPAGGAPANLAMQFDGTNLSDNSHLAKVSGPFTVVDETGKPADINNLPPGHTYHVTMKIPKSEFPATGTFFRPGFSFSNMGKTGVTIANTSLVPDPSEAADVYKKINSINPYATGRSWTKLNDLSKPINYDLTKGDISNDWGKALTGNTMFPADPTKANQVPGKGVQLDSTHTGGKGGVSSDGGIIASQYIDPMRDFNASVTFTPQPYLDPKTGKPMKDAQGNYVENPYQPTFAWWGFGDSQGGPDDPGTHTNGSSGDRNTEFDCEMGSDNGDGTPAAAGTMNMRNGSYVGHAHGGKSEIFDANKMPVMPDIYKPNPKTGKPDTYTVSMTGKWEGGELHLTRTIVDVTTGKSTDLGTQDLGKGPFAPMIMKCAMENPNWNAKGQVDGKQSVDVSGISIGQGPDIPENDARRIPNDHMDFGGFTPGGGGGLPCGPFAPEPTASDANVQA